MLSLMGEQTIFEGVLRNCTNVACSNRTNAFLSHNNQIHIHMDIRYNIGHSKDIFRFGLCDLYYIQKYRWYLRSSRRCNQSALVLSRQYNSQIRLVNPQGRLYGIKFLPLC